MKNTNTIVVGQGIAGSLMAFMLHKQKIPCKVIDPGYENTSSRIAAGMFTPISGKRKTIHPLALQQIPFAINIYKEIEKLIGENILHLHNIYQVYSSTAEKNALVAKSAIPEFSKYIFTDPGQIRGLKQEMGACEFTHSGWIDCGLMIAGFARYLKQNDVLIEEEFIYEDLQVGNSLLGYHGMEFCNIIFCEGYKAIHNPFFKDQNIIPCKGDMLSISYDHSVTDRIIKKNGIYLIPAGKNKFRAGASYQWNNNSEDPDDTGKYLVEGLLDAMLENKYVTIDHKAAIRPTTKTREVIARQHSQHAGMFILNGLGTKGVLQGPWWAKKLLDLF